MRNATLATLASVASLALFATGCLQDGDQGPQGPAGEDGEAYLSTTNPVTGEITTIAVSGATTGDNSPVSINVNVNTGDNGNAGNSRPVAAPEVVEEPAEEEEP